MREATLQSVYAGGSKSQLAASADSAALYTPVISISYLSLAIFLAFMWSLAFLF
jgi:hypothetical protein